MAAYKARSKRSKSPYRGRGRNTVETNPFSRGAPGNFIKQPATEDSSSRDRKRGRTKLS